MGDNEHNIDNWNLQPWIWGLAAAAARCAGRAGGGGACPGGVGWEVELSEGIGAAHDGDHLKSWWRSICLMLILYGCGGGAGSGGGGALWLNTPWGAKVPVLACWQAVV